MGKSFLHYEILGVPRSATPAEIGRAYKLRALQVHPDKCFGDKGATQAFQQLREAYEVLRDPERRVAYNATGDQAEGGGIGCNADVFRSQFRPVSPEEITAFESSYRGSPEERCDVAAFVRSKKGDVAKLFDYIICSDPADVDRYVELLQELLSTGEAPPDFRDAIITSTPKLRRAAAAQLKRNRRERKDLECSAAPAGHAAAGGDLQALALRIRARQQQRGWAASLAEMVEAKYCHGGDAGHRGRGRNAPKRTRSSRPEEIVEECDVDLVRISPPRDVAQRSL